MRVYYTNFGDPIRKPAFGAWFRFSRYYSGRLYCVSVKHHQLTFDFRGWFKSDPKPRARKVA